MLDLTLALLVLLADPPEGPRPRQTLSQERWQERYASAMEKLHSAQRDSGRLYARDFAAKAAFETGRLEEARDHALALLDLGDRVRGAGRGQAVHDAHVVLGRVALRGGDVEQAKRELLLAGRTRGSPVLGSFGPNMSLAKDLLEQRQVDVVVEYFGLCEKFWKMNRGRLALWTEQAKAGQIPDFRANLVY